MKNIFFLIVGLAVIVGSIFLFWTRPIVGESKTKVLKINDRDIKAEVVDTPEKRELGLSGRPGLVEGTGMLFVFERTGKYGFWMKDMNFPIDIVWVGENYQVVDTDRNLAPETFPQVFYPEQAVKYVLELPAGAVDNYLIATGTVVQF